MADVLLDQTVSAGIGNVYKCEALFLERVHPWTATGDLDDERLRKHFARARDLIRRNLAGGPRNTTGRREPRLWIYGARRRSCPVCGGVPRYQHQGDDARITWWCPICQGGGERA